MKSRKAYNKTLKSLEKMKKESEKKYGKNSSNDNYIIAFELGYQTRITDEFIEKGIKI